MRSLRLTTSLFLSLQVCSCFLVATASGACPDQWVLSEEQCYGLVSGSVSSVYTARQACLIQGADIVNLGSTGEHTVVTNLLTSKAPSAGKIYIGLNDIEVEGTFVNSVNDTTTFYKWPTSGGEPNNLDDGQAGAHCVVLNRATGTWPQAIMKDVDCCKDKNINQVVCSKPKSSNVQIAPDDDLFAKACFKDVDDCASHGCKNGATCEDRLTYYQCVCNPGYTGDRCEIVIDYCSPNPCENGAVCRNEAGSYMCDCQQWYGGVNCSQETSLCVNDPCKNNATCSGDLTTYNCSCVPGFEGNQCETNIDECVRQNVNCSDHGQCVDGVNEVTCDCDTGYTGTYCNQEIRCIGLPTIHNATSTNATSATYQSGDEVMFVCDGDLKFMDMTSSKALSCQREGWMPRHLACEPHCASLPIIPHTTVANGNTHVGNVVNYTCNLGYIFPDNSTFLNITCHHSRQWSIPPSRLPQCEIVKCPELPTRTRQERDTNNNTYGTTVTFWCDVGYSLHDQTTARTIKCKYDGQWTARLPECQPVKCPPVADLTGVSSNTTVHTYDTYVEHSCAPSTRMRDGATWKVIRCEANAEWSDNITDCQPNRCYPLPFVANATPSALDALEGTTVTLTCIRGHRFDVTTLSREQKSMTCGSGRWTPILTYCEPIMCDVLTAPLHATLSTTERLFSTRVNVTCDTGYYYNAATGGRSSTDVVECMEDGAWDKSIKTITKPCQPVPCPYAPDIYNGTRAQGATGYVYSQKVEYNCDSGFKFADGRLDKKITCMADGQWDDQDVSCRKDRCDPVPMASFVVPDTTNVSWYTTVHYNCRPGYEWLQPDSLVTIITCLNTGQWNTTSISACTAKQCPTMMTMPYGSRNVTVEPQYYDAYVDYTCDVGYKYPDNETTKVQRCDEDGAWNPPTAIFPKCEIIHCPDLMDVENATRLSNHTYYNTSVVFRCGDGYQFPDKTLEKSITCTENATWTPYPPSCEVVFCPPLPTGWSQTEFNSTVNEFNAIVSYWCKSNYSFGLYGVIGGIWKRMEDGQGKKLFEDEDTIKVSLCTEQKYWDPAIADCLETVGIADDLKGVAYESPEGATIGTAAIAILTVMLTTLILLDLSKLYTDLKIMVGNIKHFMRRSNPKVATSQDDLHQEATPID